MNSGSILFVDGRDDPELKRVKRDALASGETGSAPDARQSETLAGRVILHQYQRNASWPYRRI